MEMLGVEPRASCMQSKRSPAELHPPAQPALGASPSPLTPSAHPLPTAAPARTHPTRPHQQTLGEHPDASRGSVLTTGTCPPRTGQPPLCHPALPSPCPACARVPGAPGEGGCPKGGLVRELNPGPLAPKARIIPLDQRAGVLHPKAPPACAGHWGAGGAGLPGDSGALGTDFGDGSCHHPLGSRAGLRGCVGMHRLLWTFPQFPGKWENGPSMARAGLEGPRAIGPWRPGSGLGPSWAPRLVGLGV